MEGRSLSDNWSSFSAASKYKNVFGEICFFELSPSGTKYWRLVDVTR